MGERTSHTPGTFSWTDLATTDTDAAKRFYTALFGWDFDDQPIPGDGGVYTMLRRDGKDVAALFQAQEGMPTAWSSYVTVESADAAATKAADLGGTPMGEAFDVMDAGRMAVIQDPTGAAVSVWEPHGSIGAQFVNGPGALSLNQLNTPDPEAAGRFSDLFGWRTEQVAGGDQPYWGIYNGDRLNGGMMQLPPDAPAPPHWLVYFGSNDVDADAGRIGELGGQVIVPPADVPGGRFLVAQDPQGAVVGLFAGRFDD
jgi:uncharacterized protein